MAAKTEKKMLEGQLRDKINDIEKERDETISSLLVNMQELEQENAHMLELLSRQPEPMTSTIEARSIKTDLLIAIAPQLNIDHPRSEAQKAERVVDIMLEVWGL